MLPIVVEVSYVTDNRQNQNPVCLILRFLLPRCNVLQPAHLKMFCQPVSLLITIVGIASGALKCISHNLCISFQFVLAALSELLVFITNPQPIVRLRLRRARHAPRTLRRNLPQQFKEALRVLQAFCGINRLRLQFQSFQCFRIGQMSKNLIDHQCPAFVRQPRLVLNVEFPLLCAAEYSKMLLS